MAYCNKCGAYIPDGQSACLACGYDESAAARQQNAAASAQASSNYGFTNDDLREKLRRQREEQQEQSRRWAEQEKERRDRQEADRQWAREEYERRRQEKEYARRQAEQEQQSRSYVNRSAAGSGGGAQTGQGNKALAALSYLSFLFVLPSIFTPQDKYARFHARQGLKLFILGLGADLLGSLIGVGWIVSLARFYLIYKGMNNALNGLTEPLPWIGNIGENNSSNP